METLMKADIFFFITSIVMVVWGMLLTIILLYVISIVRSIKRMVELAGQELESIAEDFSEIRSDVKSGVATTRRYAQNMFTGISMGKVVTFLINTVSEAKARKSRKRARKVDADSDNDE